jgi:hypothetical protein
VLKYLSLANTHIYIYRSGKGASTLIPLSSSLYCSDPASPMPLQLHAFSVPLCQSSEPSAPPETDALAPVLLPSRSLSRPVLLGFEGCLAALRSQGCRRRTSKGRHYHEGGRPPTQIRDHSASCSRTTTALGQAILVPPSSLPVQEP